MGVGGDWEESQRVFLIIGVGPVAVCQFIITNGFSNNPYNHYLFECYKRYTDYTLNIWLKSV